ncbi:MAG TPA: Hpt domain-containing protein, partial [Chroococcales cyanobacterium]
MEPNADNELLQLFVEEAKENLFGLESDLIQIEAGGSNADSDLIHKVFRAVHSVKGAAGCLSLTSESLTLATAKDLSHRLENLLVLIRDKVLVPSPGITNILLEGVDQLAKLIECIGAEKESEDGEAIIGQLSRLDAVIA